MTNLDERVLAGEKALGILRRIHEGDRIKEHDTSIKQEIAELLGQPGDVPLANIKKKTQKMRKDAPDYNRLGWVVLANAIDREAGRLNGIANAIGAGSASTQAIEDMKALYDMIENSL